VLNIRTCLPEKLSEMNKPFAINIARSAGFCFGVRRAIRIAQKTARPGRKIHMLGDLVHNQDVMKDLEKSGIKKIFRLGLGRGQTLLIRAHGAAKCLIRQARRRGYAVVDATCPMVKAIHSIVRRMNQKGYRIIVLGDRQHEEVQGIVGQISGKTLVIDQISHIPWLQIKKLKKAAILVQSTQNIDHILPIVNALRKGIKEIKFFNTICRPTRMKQAEIKTMARKHDVVIVIGSRTSANTRRLYEISRALNPDSHWIESAGEVKAGWFKKTESVAITAGASTPDSTTQSVVARIRAIK